MLHITQYPSPNFNDRKGDAQASMIILHYTDLITADEALDILCNPQREASAHYLIKRSGEILQLVEEEKRAWHAGKSYWNGITDINSHSIGIEICNRGHLNRPTPDTLEPYPDIQIEAVINLCLDIMNRLQIPPENVLGHSDIAPDRKKDPGEHFPWDKLETQNVCAPLNERPKTDDDIYAYAIKSGYDPNTPKKDVVTAFKRRYLQSAI